MKRTTSTTTTWTLDAAEDSVLALVLVAVHDYKYSHKGVTSERHLLARINSIDANPLASVLAGLNVSEARATFFRLWTERPMAAVNERLINAWDKRN